MPISLK
jgi:hypothetical protein